MQKSSIKIVFFGSFEFAVPTLMALKNEGYDIVAVITNPDKPSGRKKILTPPPIKVAAQKLGLLILQPEKLRDNPNLVEQLKYLPNAKRSTLNASLGIVVGYGKLIPPEIFNLPAHGTLTIHPSLLPKYRGPSPVQTAMLNGDNDTGVTIIEIDEELDHGDILAAESHKLSPTATYEEAHNALFNLGADLLIKTLPDYLTDKIQPQPQDHSQATFTRKFTTEDGEIKQTETAQQAYNKIRALNPEPGAYIWLEKNPLRLNLRERTIRLKILEAELRDGRLEFKKVQLEGGKPITFKEFHANHPQFRNNLLQ